MSETPQLEEKKLQEPPPPIEIYNELSDDETDVTPHANSFDFPIRPSSFSVWPPREIGKGRFSSVFQTKLGDADVVLKVCRKLRRAGINDELTDVDKELDILSQIGRHPNLMYAVAVCEHLVDAGITKNSCYDIGPVFPLKAGGNLEEFVKHHPEIIDDPVSLQNILLGVCRGVQALHNQRIVHRDIACRNFLVDQSGRIVLSDFGLSRKLKLIENGENWFEETLENYERLYYKQQKSVVAFRWVSPESLESRKYTLRSDLWSIGVLCLELASKCEVSPLKRCRSAASVVLTFKENPDYAIDDLPDDCSPLLRQFVKKCCNTNPELRAKIHELIDIATGSHPFFDEASCEKTQCVPSISNPPRVTPSDFSPAKWQCIGSGRFSNVYKSTLNGEDVAVKVCKILDYVDPEQELAVLEHVGKHPNLLSLKARCENIEVSDGGDDIFHVGIVMQLHSRGNLEDYVKKNPDIVDHELRLRNILLGICRGVQALHGRKVVHRDIACRNFLIDASGRIVLADYGLSRIIPQGSDSFEEDEDDYPYLFYESEKGICPLRHTAPEALVTLKFTCRSDIWSIGVVCIELALKCMKTPFSGLNTDGALVAAFHDDNGLALKQLPPGSPHILREVTRQCCNVVTHKRPRIQELIDIIASYRAVPEPEPSRTWGPYENPSRRENVSLGAGASWINEYPIDHIQEGTRLKADENLAYDEDEQSMTFERDNVNSEDTSASESSVKPTRKGSQRLRRVAEMLPYANLYDHKELASGHFSLTYVSFLRRQNEAPLRVVCKVPKDLPGENEWQELQILASMNPHPLVVKLVGICIDWQGRDLALIFEYHSGGTLETYMRDRTISGESGLQHTEVIKLAYAMATSIRHIHGNDVLHRDIAPRNFVLRDDGLPVLIDFGMSRKVTRHHQWNHKSQDDKVHKMVYTTEDFEYRSVGDKPAPWRTMPLESLDRRILSTPASDFEEGAPQPITDLIKQMCSISAKLRPTIAEICDALKPHVHEDFAKFETEPSALNDDGHKLPEFDGITEESTPANVITDDATMKSKKAPAKPHTTRFDLHTHHEDEVKSTEVEDIETPTSHPRAKRSTYTSKLSSLLSKAVGRKSRK